MLLLQRLEDLVERIALEKDGRKDGCLRVEIVRRYPPLHRRRRRVERVDASLSLHLAHLPDELPRSVCLDVARSRRTGSDRKVPSDFMATP